MSPQMIHPYGDRRDDGGVQLSFVLPVKASEKAREAAIQLAKKLGFEQVLVATMEPAADNYTFFVVYGHTHVAIDYDSIQVPALHVGGWYDVFVDGTLTNWAGLRLAGHAPQRLVVGPWHHLPALVPAGPIPFGQASLRDLISEALVGDEHGEWIMKPWWR